MPGHQMNSVRNLFLRQSYQDSWSDYQYLLTHGKPARWDWFVITASNSEQARAYEMQIEYRVKNGWLPSGTQYLVIPDPQGKRVGSGGATLNVLRQIAELENGRDPFAGKRIVVLHSGGDSKRVPQYSACGKLFSRVPRELPDGRCSTLFDEFVIALSGVPGRMSDGLLVMSGDVLMLFNPLQIDLQREGTACISIKAPVEMGEHHGVFLPGDNGCVKGFLHKQSREQLKAAGAVNSIGHVDIDTGAIWMSSHVVKELLSLFINKGRICESLFLRFVNERVRLSFYGDFVYPMTIDATLSSYLQESAEGIPCSELYECRTAIWNILHHYPMHLIRLSPAEFIHFGTTRELRDLMQVASEKYGFLGWSRNVMSTGTSEGVHINSVIDQEAQIARQVYIEDSHIAAEAVVGEGSVVSNACFSGHLPPNTALHVLPVIWDAKPYFVARIYGVNDNPKEGLHNGGMILGTSLGDFISSTGIGVEEIWTGEDKSLWSARLYPVCETEDQAVKAALLLSKITSGGAAPLEIHAWRNYCRMSMQESFEAACTEEIMLRQEKLEDTHPYHPFHRSGIKRYMG